MVVFSKAKFSILSIYVANSYIRSIYYFIIIFFSHAGLRKDDWTQLI